MLALCLIILIGGIISGCAELEKLTKQQAPEQTPEQTQQPVPATQQQTQPVVSPVRQTAYESGQFSFTEFPTVKTTELAVGRYEIHFETDSNIQFVVYSQERYEQWKETGAHTISKATTQQGTSCCTSSRTFTVDVNQGEEGLYYLVFDATKVSSQPTVGQITITDIGDI